MPSQPASFLSRLGKIVLWFVGAFLALVALAVAAVYLSTGHRLRRSHEVKVAAVPVPNDETSLARGRHIATTRGCADCHDGNFAGRAVIEDPMVGHLHGPNLTRGAGGLPPDFTDLDYVRAIRHGLARDGRALLLMPSAEYTGMSDEDLGSLIAYLKTVPPVDRPRGPVSPGPIARVLMVKGEIKLAAEEIDHAAPRPARVPETISVDYGRYLAVGCTGCHGTLFAGGRIPGAPPDWPLAANLTPHESARLRAWSEADFFAALRTQRRPDGSQIHPVMPAAFGQLTDNEIKALWLYLRSLEPQTFGTH